MLTLTLFLGAPAIDLGRAPLADEAVFDLGRGRLLQEGRKGISVLVVAGIQNSFEAMAGLHIPMMHLPPEARM